MTGLTGWQRVVVIVAGMAFTTVVLWLTASTFDASEIKSVLGIAAGIAAREYLPEVKAFLKPLTDALHRGGQVE